MPHVLRAISGPQAGAVYVLGERTLIGRASDCDIQILHEGVSRHHARISREPDGALVVVDLASDNGTLVEDERVERHVLVEGEELRVVRARFVFELHQEADAVTSEVFRRKTTSGVSLRQTVPYERMREREPASRRARMTPAVDGPSGRMAPAAPMGVGAEAEPRVADSGGTSASLGAGWARIPRPQVAECGMRPGATLGSSPRLDEPTSRATAMMPGVAAPATSLGASPRGRITAEYGAIADGPGRRSRLTRSPRWTLHPPTPIAYEDTLRIDVGEPDEGEPDEGEPDEGEQAVRSRS